MKFVLSRIRQRRQALMLVMQRSETGELNARRRRLSDLNCTSKCGDDTKYRNFKVENAGRLGKTGKSPLEELKTQLKELSDWGPDAVVAAVAGYQRFLQLKVSAADHEAVKVSPPPVIDFVWHTHMRDGNNYKGSFASVWQGEPSLTALTLFCILQQQLHIQRCLKN